jgi:hypothetical protein
MSSLFTRVPRETVRKASEGVHDVALRIVEKAPFGPFALLLAAKSTLGVLLESLFGQFQKVNSPKFGCRILHRSVLQPAA